MTSTIKGLLPGWVLVALAVAVVAVAAIAALATPGQTQAGPTTSATLEVTKLFSDANDTAEITVSLECDDGTVDPDEPQTLTGDGDSVEFTVEGFDTSATCSAVEETGPVGYTVDLEDCTDVELIDEATEECDITNILNETTVTVNKVFADDDDDKNGDGNGNGNGEPVGKDELVVEIILVCPEHVTVEPGIAEAEEDKKTGVWTAEFDVSGFDPGDTCTASELPIEGWIGFSVDCIDMDLMPEDDDKNDNGNGNNVAGGNDKNGIECLITNLPAQTEIWGDVDCNGVVSIGDAVKIARSLLDLPVDQEEGCPEIGAQVVVMQAPVDDDNDKNDNDKNDNGNGNETAGEDKNGEVIVSTEIWGDVDCGGDVVIGDAVKVARSLLDLSVDQEEGCPEIGQEVLLAIVPPDDDDDDDKNGDDNGNGNDE